MLSSLTTLLKTSLELALASRDDKNGNICLCSTRNHVGDVRLVTRSIKDSVSSRVCLKVSSTNFYSLTL